MRHGRGTIVSSDGKEQHETIWKDDEVVEVVDDKNNQKEEQTETGEKCIQGNYYYKKEIYISSVDLLET